jgi:putative redox protein
MATELSAHVVLRDGLCFEGGTRLGHTVLLDAAPPQGKGVGMTPMELVLIGLAGCSGMDVAAILRKKRQPIEGLEVRAHSLRSDGHPTVFTTINLEYIVHGMDVEPEAVGRAIELSKERYCPIWAMLDPSVRITASYRVICDDPVLVPAD